MLRLLYGDAFALRDHLAKTMGIGLAFVTLMVFMKKKGKHGEDEEK
jgi:hypothetical protein